MNNEELKQIIGQTNWFTHLGMAPNEEDATSKLSIADESWEWLPTGRDQTDPIHGTALLDLCATNQLSKHRISSESEVAKLVLVALRHLDQHAKLQDGPHDYTEAARGGAVYAARMAAREIVAGKIGFWCRAFKLFSAGFWPCGFTKDYGIVVY